jgi:hypothetical protein
MRTVIYLIPILVLIASLGSNSLLLADPGSDSHTTPKNRTALLRFDSEVIRIFVEPDSLRIEGHYRFVVSGPRSGHHTMFYPYPSDSLLGGARTLSLECRHGDLPWRALDFQELSNARGARWPVPLPDGAWVEIRTVYRQARLANYGCYIVTTTSEWEQPLRQARFEIHLPPGASPLSFSHPFKPADSIGDNCYLFEANDFFPAEDIRFTWRD